MPCWRSVFCVAGSVCTAKVAACNRFTIAAGARDETQRAVPHFGLHLREPGFGRGDEVRHQGRARLAGNRERNELAGFRLRLRQRDVAEDRVDVSAEESLREFAVLL